MKRILIVILAILSGAILSITTLIHAQREEKTPLYVLQLGKYSQKENAINKSRGVSSVILEKDGFYYVLAGLSTDETILKKVENLLIKKGIHYYKTQMNVFSSQLKNLKNYEMLLERSTEEETIVFLNKKMLESVSL